MPNDLDTKAIFQTLDGLKARFGDRFIVGLSGGGDSLTLAHLCAAWRKESGAHVSALCIDHGFRPEAANEARQAAAWALTFGLEAQVVTNPLPAPVTGLQEFARNLRLNVFAKAAFDMGGATILLGHTCDDQAETIAFRLARQTGLDGLAGMALVTEGLAVWQGIAFPIARPLLGFSRADLRHYLKALGQDWIEDPSNQNRGYARVKIRQRLTNLGQSERLVRIGGLARALREALDAQSDALEQRVSRGSHLIASAFLEAEHDLQAKLLHRKLVSAGAPARPIAREKLDNLLRSMTLCDFRGATLAGVKVTLKHQEFHFTKAPARREVAQPQREE
jgi:tRNA(Ile)-lysidine synthase